MGREAATLAVSTGPLRLPARGEFLAHFGRGQTPWHNKSVVGPLPQTGGDRI